MSTPPLLYFDILLLQLKLLISVLFSFLKNFLLQPNWNKNKLQNLPWNGNWIKENVKKKEKRKKEQSKNFDWSICKTKWSQTWSTIIELVCSKSKSPPKYSLYKWFCMLDSPTLVLSFYKLFRWFNTAVKFHLAKSTLNPSSVFSLLLLLFHFNLILILTFDLKCCNLKIKFSPELLLMISQKSKTMSLKFVYT